MKYFVDEKSIVRRIWGKSDIILFIFAGAAAEFALNKAVDWLYFTGKLPSDPIGRLFSTVGYAREIVFSSEEKAIAAIEHMRLIHESVESKRGFSIPDWAYRDVLYMLIYYSISSFELIERKLNEHEKQEVFDVFKRVGESMGLKQLPQTHSDWLIDRQQHLETDLEKSNFTIDLFAQYEKQLGWMRYNVLIEAQKLLVPARVINLLGFNSYSLIAPLVPIYKFCRRYNIEGIFKEVLLPKMYKSQIKRLDVIRS